eukprot:7376645-Alexandrium_andersonii.AAC.1
MSASLVGSEMCIRDSSATSGAPLRRRASPRTWPWPSFGGTLLAAAASFGMPAVVGQSAST